MRFTATIRKQGLPDEVRVVEADSRFKVYDLIRREGGYVASITEERGWLFGGLARLAIPIGSGVQRIEVIRVAKNLAAMLTAGLSVSRALSIIERQTSNAHMKTVMNGVAESIKKGVSLHEAMASYPTIFPELFVAMVKSGEESGSLTDSLLAVALQMERSEELKRRIRGAMIYPAIVIVAVVVVAILMLVYVVPTLTGTFTALGVEVPLATRIIVALSDFAVAHALFVSFATLAAIAGSFLFARSHSGAAIIVSLALRTPIIGELVRETYTARAARTLSSLLTAGVPVLDALAITKEVVGARAYAAVIEEAQAHVRKGEPMSLAFSGHPHLYPVVMSDMLMVGEETGNVAEMLRQIADFYEGDVAERTKDLSSVIEPFLMILIGVVVGIFAVSMIAPIYQLSSAI